MVLLGALALPVNSAFAQFLPRPTAPASPAWTYADTADVFAAAPIVLRARIALATALKDAVVPPAVMRFYVEADVTVLIRGAGGVPPRVRYLIDVSRDSQGRLPRLKKADVLIAARAVADRPGEIQLVAPDAQQPWTAPLDARVHAIVADAADAAAPPEITGVSSAFHVPGTVIGESETQIFLATVNGAPVSVTVLRRPGEPSRWALALGEIVDEAAARPLPDTLTWYRLACFLPADLPGAAARDLAQADAEAAREDYALVRRDLGDCPRTRALLRGA